MMKAKDCAVATSLIIQGFLRANDEGNSSPQVQNMLLNEAVEAIRQECDDWAENLLDSGSSAAIVLPASGGLPHDVVANIQSLIDLTNDLAARIDAATDKPVGKLEQWESACRVLRFAGVKVEDVVVAPANWS